jgi:hypothetical protein
MGGAAVPWNRHGLTLGVAVSAVTLAVLVLRAASPSDVGVRAATAAALVVGLGGAFALWVDAMRHAAARSDATRLTYRVAFLLRFPTVCCSSRLAP